MFLMCITVVMLNTHSSILQTKIDATCALYYFRRLVCYCVTFWCFRSTSAISICIDRFVIVAFCWRQVVEECKRTIAVTPNVPFVVCELKALSNSKVRSYISPTSIHNAATNVDVYTCSTNDAEVLPKLFITVFEVCPWLCSGLSRSHRPLYWYNHYFKSFFTCSNYQYTVEPLTNDHPHQRPSLSYDHISCDGLCIMFV